LRSRQRITLLVNPHAGGGLGAQRADAARLALARVAEVETHVTSSGADLLRRAGHAAACGDRVLALLGGDGSVSLAARALMERGGQTALAIFAAGAGTGLAGWLGAPVHDYDAMAALAARESVRRIDAGAVDDVTFVNAAGFGFDVETLTRMRATGETGETGAPLSGSDSQGFGGARARYARAALGALWSYQGFSASVHGPGAADARRASRLMLVFANGRAFGGAFRIAPMADLTDGALDLISIGGASPLRRLSLFARAVRGTHVHCAEVTTTRGAAFEIRFDAPPLFEADGELHQAVNAVVRVRCVPGALKVVAP
jgi:diacylglycerol kinase (ATP)